jgi:NDP-sugar pyrophosphorylase family protein
MKALILAAGKGTRLKQLTENKPKALVEIGGITLLERVIRNLISFGIQEVVINIHHFGDQIIEFIIQKKSFGIDIAFSDERNELLDTGGAIWKAAPFFSDGKSFLVHNVDVFSDLNLTEIAMQHNNNDSIATLAVFDRTASRHFLFDEDGRLTGWQNTKTMQQIIVAENEKSLIPFAFCGIHMIDPKIFTLLPKQGAFSIVETYLELAGISIIKAFVPQNLRWMDFGKIEDLELAERFLSKLTNPISL